MQPMRGFKSDLCTIGADPNAVYQSGDLVPRFFSTIRRGKIMKCKRSESWGARTIDFVEAGIDFVDFGFSFANSGHDFSQILCGLDDLE